ncbi:hypothetical protein PoB_005010000 [Plakobranchus ocellatus]|uniref:Uncharacterized protein n=1 Tax=Plakobranchus ocellatus TaxID=259542 RepID=A0AAV4BWT9_9GAST|nr:hypothetical protein PoB_005010000 [Plakobranchus ocellatus]
MPDSRECLLPDMTFRCRPYDPVRIYMSSFYELTLLSLSSSCRKKGIADDSDRPGAEVPAFFSGALLFLLVDSSGFSARTCTNKHPCLQP